eukprot:15864-Heterococcus_DN1.PRE.4
MSLRKNTMNNKVAMCVCAVHKAQPAKLKRFAYENAVIAVTRSKLSKHLVLAKFYSTHAKVQVLALPAQLLTAGPKTGRSPEHGSSTKIVQGNWNEYIGLSPHCKSAVSSSAVHALLVANKTVLATKHSKLAI